MSRPTKKVILFVVEGPSEVAALERPIQKMLDGNPQDIEAAFLVAETDVTSDFRNTPDNIAQKINRFYFEPFFSANEHYYPKDIIEVVQICDLDGAFIPEENCHMFTESIFAEDGFIYDPPHIYGASAETVIERNNHKAENIRYLLTLDSIKVKTKTRPYSLFFFSANIDHYLHGGINLPGREKIRLAEKYADTVNSSTEVFLTSIYDNPASIKDMTYEETWDYAMSGTNSIEKHSNFNIYLSSLEQRLHSDF